MRRSSVFAAIILASLLAVTSGDPVLLDAAEAGEPIANPAPTMVAQAQPSAAPAPTTAAQFQTSAGGDRIAVYSGSNLMSWYGHELKLIGPDSIGIFREGDGEMVGVNSCRCTSDVGSCTPVVAVETPHYAFCAKGRGDACAGECTVE